MSKNWNNYVDHPHELLILNMFTRRFFSAILQLGGKNGSDRNFNLHLKKKIISGTNLHAPKHFFMKRTK